MLSEIPTFLQAHCNENTQRISKDSETIAYGKIQSNHTKEVISRRQNRRAIAIY